MAEVLTPEQAAVGAILLRRYRGLLDARYDVLPQLEQATTALKKAG